MSERAVRVHPGGAILPHPARLIPRRDARRGGLILLFGCGKANQAEAEALAEVFAEGGWDALLLPLRAEASTLSEVQACAASLLAPVFLLGCGGAAAAAVGISQGVAGLCGTAGLPAAEERLTAPGGDLTAPLLLHQPRAIAHRSDPAPEGREGLMEFTYQPSEMGEWTGASDTARLALLRTRQFFHRLAGPREAGA